MFWYSVLSEYRAKHLDELKELTLEIKLFSRKNKVLLLQS